MTAEKTRGEWESMEKQEERHTGAVVLVCQDGYEIEYTSVATMAGSLDVKKDVLLGCLRTGRALSWTGSLGCRLRWKDSPLVEYVPTERKSRKQAKKENKTASQYAPIRLTAKDGTITDYVSMKECTGILGVSTAVLRRVLKNGGMTEYGKLERLLR